MENTIKKISVQNMKSNNGNTIPNQFEIITPDGIYFQSYSTIIAFRARDGKISLDADKWDFSKTTGKYRNAFLRETRKETEKKIKSGVYQLVNLN
jgi:hypothetical protein